MLELAIEEAKIGVENKEGGPFGAIVVDAKGNVVGKGHNTVLKTKDPTNHAEILAIKNACKTLQTADLSNCTIYSTCEPCPMCLSAIIWANIKTIHFGATRQDAEKIGFRDKKIYDFIQNKNQLLTKIEEENTSCKELLETYDGERY